ncbi:MAG: AMP-binding protein, partial [Actinobacteria bacterium]|nr:AMP-binding protein [Actinomycetota bacterium]
MSGQRAAPVPGGPAVDTFWQLVEHGAAAFTDHVVLRDDHGRALTGRGLLDAAETAAAGLAGLGVGAGTRVSWQIPTTLESLVVTCALARLGAVQNPIVPVLRGHDVAFIVDQLGS